MDLRWVGSIALLAVIAVSALFLFPLAHGSYTATHGPSTALRAKRFRTVVMFIISATAFAFAQALVRFMVTGRTAFAAAVTALDSVFPAYSPLRR